MNNLYCLISALILSIGLSYGQQSSTTLDHKLKALSKQHNINIAYNPKSLSGVTIATENLSFQYEVSPDDALTVLLRNTGFTYRKIGRSNFAIVQHPKVTTQQVEPQITAPSEPSEYQMAKVALKTNLLADASTTLNLGLEIALGKRTTLSVSANYNPWVFSDNTKMQHIAVQPEFRYYFRERFNGHFLGANVFGANYNAGGLSLFAPTRNYRFDGYLAGAGLIYGYQWILSSRVNMEAAIGGGYARIWYNKSDCKNCGRYISSGAKNYFGPTKLSLSLIIILD